MILSFIFCVQVSYSVIDTRPKNKMASLCKEKNVKILAYGTLMVISMTSFFLLFNYLLQLKIKLLYF